MKKNICGFFMMLISLMVYSQSMRHPAIWITENERAHVLKLVEQYDWAADIVSQLHKKVDNKKVKHFKSPSVLLKSIPALGGEKSMKQHNAVLSLAAESGMLYFLTKDESYARFSADIIAVYTSRIASLTPQTTSIMGYCFDDCRTCYNMLSLAYDFVYNYLISGKAHVFSVTENQRVAFDNVEAQKAFMNIVGDIYREYDKQDEHGRIISNHPVLTAPAALYAVLCIDDDDERERMFDVFWEKGTWNQPSFKHTILPALSKQGIWPESLSYSFMPNISMILNIVDRIKPEMNIVKDYMHIFKGNFLFDYLRMPDGRFVRFGDSKRNNDGTEANYNYALSLAKRRGYKQLEEMATEALCLKYNADGGRNPQLSSYMYDNYYGYLQLFWGIPLPNLPAERLNYKPTVIIEHAGVALQRNYVDRNNEWYGLCGIIGGGHYVHSHLTGISMELYGAGYVMAPNAGMPVKVSDRWIPLHEHYRRLYAGNNTVVVNGTSHGLEEGSWKGKYWQNTAVNIAAEPQHLQNPISSTFSFVTQFLKDEVNGCDQERTLSIVRTSEKTGYYFDLFRSKSFRDNHFHDYIYHNIGDDASVFDKYDKHFVMENTERYKNDIGDVVHSPGWSFFENTKTTKPIKELVKIRFDIAYNNCYMHMFMPGGVDREYTKGIAPPTPEAKNGYLDKKTQVLVVRQQGEAWYRPYISVFEPSMNKESSVKNVEPLMTENRIAGAKVTSKIDGVEIVDYIISQDVEKIYVNKTLTLEFSGRFGIVRIEKREGKQLLTLYIGEGEKISYNGISLFANSDGKAMKNVKIE